MNTNDLRVYSEVMTGRSDCFADCPPCTASSKPWPGNKKEEIPMSSLSSATVITADSIEKDQRRYIVNRIYGIADDLRNALKKQFGLKDDDAPETMTEFAARIAAGKYVIPEKYADASAYSVMSYIRWRDPSAKEDKAGYAAAKPLLADARQAAEDAAALLPIADATKAMNDFAAWKLPTA